MQKKLFLLDAMALVYRAYYAMVRSPRITTNGLNTSAIFGFANVLLEVIKSEKPTHLAVAFDTGAPTIRHADYEAYKANRDATPEDIHLSIPHIFTILKALRIPILAMDGYEADDIIGTVAKKAESEGFEVFMMTSDKDYGQLVSEHIHMYKPGKFGQKAEVVGVSQICEKYELTYPEQLIDILGLWGDSSDNIPGVPNIGEVKAKKLIKEFGSIEAIYKNIDNVANAKLRQTLIDHQDQALLSKSLATIILDVPIECNVEQMKLQSANVDALKTVFYQLEFKTLLQRFLNEFNTGVMADQKAPDLFSQFDVVMEVEEEVNPFKTYSNVAHNFIAVSQWDDILEKPSSEQTLYFDWIFDRNEKIMGFAFGSNEEKVYYHIIDNEQNNYRSILSQIFLSTRTIVTYQAKAIFKFLPTIGVEEELSIFDLQIAHYLMQPEVSHQLDRLTESYLQYQMMAPTKIWNHEMALKEANERIEVMIPLYPIFNEALRNDKLLPLFSELEMPLCNVLAKMEMIGIKLDDNILEEASASLAEDIKALEKDIFELAQTNFNLASPKQLGEVLFEKLQIITNAKLTKTKQYQTGEEVLRKLVTKHPIVQRILDWRALSKLKSTYIDPLPHLMDNTTRRIHSTFQQTVTATGRLSSTNPNLQNIPIRTERGKEIRKAFVAKDSDHVILSADYSQIELRIVASMANDENMMQAFKEKQDIHAATAANIYKLPVDEVTTTQRRYAKTVNFGILYGMSTFGLAERLQIPNGEARELIEQYNQNFPKIDQYMNENIVQARANGYVETLLGRRRYIRDINSNNSLMRKAAERNAINAPIQGTAADVIKLAMIQIDAAIKENKLTSKMILQVHDELLFEVPKTELDEMQKLLREVMENAMVLNVPLDVEMSFGHSWFDAH